LEEVEHVLGIRTSKEGANSQRPGEILPMNDATKPASNLASAKLAVMAAVPYVRKHKAEHLNYSFAGEADLIASLRPAMLAHGLSVAPIGVTVLEQGRYQTLKGARLNHVVAAVTYRLTPAPTGQGGDFHGQREP